MLLGWLTVPSAPTQQSLRGSGGQVEGCLGCPGCHSIRAGCWPRAGPGVHLRGWGHSRSQDGDGRQGDPCGFYRRILPSRCPPPARVGAGQHVQPVLCLPLALHLAAPQAPLPQLREGMRGLGWGAQGPWGLGSTHTRSGSLPADLLCPLLTPHRGTATLWPAETRACLHALLHRTPLARASARPEPVRDPRARSASVGDHRLQGTVATPELLGGSAPHDLGAGCAWRQDPPLVAAAPHARRQPVPRAGVARAAVGAGSPHPCTAAVPRSREPRAATARLSCWKCASWWVFFFQVNFGCSWAWGRVSPPAWPETAQTALT